jgi:oxygen-dependent protoporphyrinogen oxidase
LVERHYGRELVDRLADPLLSGIYGGEASSLSVRAVLPRFAEMERTHGSLGRAMLVARKQMSQAASQPARPLFASLKNGMQQLVDALLSRLSRSALLINMPIDNLRAETHGWRVSAGAKTDSFDGVILATPTHSAAKLLSSCSPELASELGGIGYSSSITVGLGYGREVRQSLPPGFGFLVPGSEGRHMLAATFVHNKFPRRAPEDRALLRCFIGGAHADEVWQLSDGELVGLVRQDLQEILQLRAEPVFARVYKWQAAMAQYGVGHLDRLKRIDLLRRQLPGLALAGNGYRGIGVPDCIRSGSEAATQVLTSLRLT